MKRVLIIGAGVAGLTLARFLRDSDFACTVLERRSERHRYGITDIDADDARILGKLGATVREVLPSPTSLDFRTAAGRQLDRLTADASEHVLVRPSALCAAIADGLTDIRTDVEVRQLLRDPKGINVGYSNGEKDRFDLVIGADGVHSSVRQRMFGAVGAWPLGGSFVALEVESNHGLPLGEAQAFLGCGAMVGLMPLGPTRLAALVYHSDDDLRSRLTSPEAAREFFAREYAHFHPMVGSLFSAIDRNSALVVDSLTMIRLPSVVSHRVALIGDAAACATVMSQRNTTFALESAELLARELTRDIDLRHALAAYDRAVMPVATQAQEAAIRLRKLLLTRSRLAVAVRDTMVKAGPNGWLLRANP